MNSGEYMNILVQALGLVGIAVNIIGIQLKNKRNILIAFTVANVIFGISFILLKSYSGGVICLIAAVQTIIKYLFDNKNKKFPLYLIYLYLIISAVCGLLTYQKYIDILPVICSVLYIISILQNKESNIRLIVLLNIVLWTIYDIYVGFYTAGINDIMLSVSTIISIYRYDILYKNKVIKRMEEFIVYNEKDLNFLTDSLFNLENGKFVYSKTIEDSYWNYITDMKVKNKREFEDIWKINRKYMLDKNRVPSLYILPSSKLIKNYKKILPDYMKIESNEIWMILDDFKNIDNIKNSKIDITINSNPDIKVFADTFMKSYEVSGDEDPYGAMPEYYRKVLIDTYKKESKFKRTYYLAYYKDIPIATSITIEKDDIALVCFVGTIKEYRNKGVCKELMKQNLKDLKSKNIKIAFLQTEEGYVPEKLYGSIGFKKIASAILAVERK